MISPESQSVADRAKAIYETQLRTDLEQSNFGRYVAIEPLSGDHFLGDTFDAAVHAAINRYPERLTHTIRIGHRAAIHLGVLTLE